MTALPSPAPRLLVFDLDGTLIDSSLDLCHAVNAALEHVGRNPLPETRIASFVGDGAATLVRRALEDTGDGQPLPGDLPEVALNHFLAFYHEHMLDNTRTYPGVLEALHEIRRRAPDLPMAVLTNKPVRPSQRICDALHLSPFFFANIGGNSFATKKPDPEGLRHLMREAAVDAAGTVMVGDSHVDVLTARAAGCRALGCSYGLAPAALQAAGPDCLVAHPMEWPNALGL